MFFSIFLPFHHLTRPSVLTGVGWCLVMQLWQYGPCFPPKPNTLPFLTLRSPSLQLSCLFLSSVAKLPRDRRLGNGIGSDPIQQTNLPILRYLFWALQFHFLGRFHLLLGNSQLILIYVPNETSSSYMSKDPFLTLLLYTSPGEWLQFAILMVNIGKRKKRTGT